MLKSKTIQGILGRTFFIDEELSFAEVMLVCRDGKPRYETSGTPTGNQWKRSATNPARFDFDETMPIELTPNISEDAPDDTGTPEKIFILYKSIS